MELTLALRNVRNRNSSHSRPERNLIEGFSPRVELKETRSSYFLNLNLQGLTKDDIRLEMDNSRTLIIRGQKHLQDIGMVGWTWRLVERDGPSSRRRKPFTIPEDVNVGAMNATFRRGLLHLVMPKFRRNRFSPYRIRIHSSSEDDRRRHPPTSMQEGVGHQTDQMIPQRGGKEFGDEKMQYVHMEMEKHDDEVSVIMTVVDQNVPTDDAQSMEVPEQPQRIEVEETKSPEAHNVCACENNPREKQPPSMEVKDPDKCESSRYLRSRKSKPAREYVLLLAIQARSQMRMKREGEQPPERRKIKVKR